MSDGGVNKYLYIYVFRFVIRNNRALLQITRHNTRVLNLKMHNHVKEDKNLNATEVKHELKQSTKFSGRIPLIAMLQSE